MNNLTPNSSNISNNIPPHQPYEKVKLDECHICLELLVGEIAEISCGHVYHLNCVQDWIMKKGSHKSCCICSQNTEIINIVNLPNTNQKIHSNTEPIRKISETDSILPNSNQNNNNNKNKNMKCLCCNIL